MSKPLPPHAPRRLQPPPARRRYESLPLCLHTLRADCNGCHSPGRWGCQPFASTRSAQIATRQPLFVVVLSTFFASTRSAQIATTDADGRKCPNSLPPHAPRRLQRQQSYDYEKTIFLCLHTLRADCNDIRAVRISGCAALPPHAPRRLQRQKCTELQYTLFRTRVESVDSFSVLNKSMLR